MKKQFEILMICALLLGSIFSANSMTKNPVILEDNCEEVKEEFDDCSLNAYGIEVLSASPGTTLLRLRATIIPGINTIVGATTFELELVKGGSIFATGLYTGPARTSETQTSQGFTEGAIEVPCNSPVKNVILHVNGRQGGTSNSCYYTTARAFGGKGLCAEPAKLFEPKGPKLKGTERDIFNPLDGYH